MNRPLPSDDALRSLHAQSLQALSPATLARLRSARHNASTAHAGRWRWWLASACSLVIALGVGVQFVGPGEHQGGTMAPVVAAEEDNGVLYDENPDLYLWLGDNDLAMEGTMLRYPSLPLLIALTLLPAASALAQSTAPAPAARPAPAAAVPLPNWEQLSPAQREALLAPLRDRWNGADPAQRQRMLSHGQRWQSMSPEERDKARRGLRRFEHMSPEQREQARALFGQMRDLSPAQRDAMRERWSQMSADERREWVRDNPPPAKPR